LCKKDIRRSTLNNEQHGPRQERGSQASPHFFGFVKEIKIRKQGITPNVKTRKDQEDLGRTNLLHSFHMTRIAQRTKIGAYPDTDTDSKAIS
jgi:hypothetical protein